MPEEFLTAEEVEEFCKKLDSTLSYFSSISKLTKEDEAGYVSTYYILKKLREVL